MITAKLLSALRAKLHHLYQFTRFAIAERDDLIGESRQITVLGMAAPGLTKDSDRTDLQVQHFEPFMAHIYGIWYASIANHDALQTLALSGHGLESMVLLRPHLESVLAFLYVTEPDKDLTEVEARVRRYRNWVIVRMKKNADKSRQLDLVKILRGSADFDKVIEQSYSAVKDSYAESPDDFDALDKFSFLSATERERLATRFGFLDFYNHVFAESSAGVHSADMGDRMTATGPLAYRYLIRGKQRAFWPIMLSLLIQIQALRQFGCFFGIRDTIESRIRAIMRPIHDAR